MEWFLELITNPYLLIGTSSWLLAQILKIIIHSIIHKKIIWERLIGDGGMPSGHSATVTSLATVALLQFGPGSFAFAASALFAVVVCHDAMGVRRETGKQAVLINEILKSFEVFATQALPEVKLKEFVGHTPIQVCAGILIGILNALWMNAVLFG